MKRPFGIDLEHRELSWNSWSQRERLGNVPNGVRLSWRTLSRTRVGSAPERLGPHG